MILLGHTATGSWVGIATYYATAGHLPLSATVMVAAAIGIASHYIFDWIPHGHYHINLGYPNKISQAAVAGDFLGSILLMMGAAAISFGLGAMWWTILGAVLGALMPDVIEMLQNYRLIPRTRWLRAHSQFHLEYLHWHNTGGRPQPWRWTDAWQIAVGVAAVAGIFSL